MSNRNAAAVIDRIVLDGDTIPIPGYLRPVLAYIALGKTNHEIAMLTGRSIKTIKNYVSELLVIAGVGNRTELALVAHGIVLSPIEPDHPDRETP